MRNLKRALSLALASVMLLGMMVVGTSAASTTFADDADIANKEAVAITSGLGIFSGKGENKFDPKATVTRAEMAVVIVKMLYGSDFDITAFEGVDKFNDVKEGDWFQGWVNLCSSLGVVSGYGDGSFKPNQTVTTAEASTMILNALAVAPAAGEWPLNYIAKATEIKLFGDLKLATNVGLTRDNLSVLVLNGIKYSPASASTGDWAYDSTKGEWVQRPGTATDSLANKVFGLNTVKGIVTNNGALTAGKKTSDIGGYTMEIATGLELIGHQVTAYYKDKNSNSAYDAKEAVYAVIDESTTFAVTSKTKDDAWKAALGVTAMPATWSYTKYDGAYASSSASAKPAETGVAIIYNKAVIGFVQPTAYTLDKVSSFTTTKDAEAINLYGAGTLANNKTSDVVVEYDGIAKNDYVVYSLTGNIYNLSKVTTLTGTPTKINGTKITIGGTEYAQAGTNASDLVAATPSFSKEYTLYLDGQGKYIAVTEKATDKVDTDLVYVVTSYSTSEKTTDAFGTEKTTTKYWVQAVDMTGNQVIYQVQDDVTVTANTLYKVATAEATDESNGKLKATYATFTASGSKSNTVTTKATDVKIANGEYYDNVKFIYVYGNKADLKVTLKEGVQALTAKNVEYVAKQVGTTSNYTVAYVIVEGAKYEAPAAEASTDVVYGVESAASTVKVPYIKDGKTETGYEHTVYVNGVKTTIVTATADAIDGFYKYTVKDGVYTLEALTKGVADNLAVANMYNGMLTLGDGTLVSDINVSGVTVVNTTTNTKVPTDATALSDKDTVAVVGTVKDGKFTAISMIYVIASTRA